MPLWTSGNFEAAVEVDSRKNNYKETTMKLSCTSVMLPRWTLDETFDKLAAYGYDGVELRCRYNPEGDAEPAFWGYHRSDVSPDNVVEKAAQIRAAAARSAHGPWYIFTLHDSW